MSATITWAVIRLEAGSTEVWEWRNEHASSQVRQAVQRSGVT